MSRETFLSHICYCACIVVMLAWGPRVFAQYPTPTPPIGSCTGLSDCLVPDIGDCGKECGNRCYTKTLTQCFTAGGSLVTCATGSCGYNTACCSIPPPGCPATREGCSWSAAWGCGGGACGCGERRTATLWCGSTHCDDACSSDASCAVGCAGPTSAPVPTTGPDDQTNAPATIPPATI